MKPTNPIETMDVYASTSQYVSGPTAAQQAAGTIPLDTLPADWWNWLWKQITLRINEAASGVQSVYDEILSVLEAASVEPSETSVNQLLVSIQALIRTPGTADTAGTVKSSSDSGKVSIDANGYMTPNGMGVPTNLNTTAKAIVSAVNEVLSNFNAYVTSNDAAVSGLNTSKAPNNHASTETTYGIGTSTNYGHVKLSDTYNTEVGAAADGLAASQKAVSAAYTELKNSAVSIPTGLIFPFAGGSTKVPAGYLLCDGSAYPRADYPTLFAVIGTTYGSSGDTVFNVPDLRQRFIEGANDQYEDYKTGTVKEAGLPNIKGDIFSSSDRGGCLNGDDKLTKTTAKGYWGYAGSTYGGPVRVNIDASRYNSTYSDDCDTVQPPAICLNYIIKT